MTQTTKNPDDPFDEETRRHISSLVAALIVDRRMYEEGTKYPRPQGWMRETEAGVRMALIARPENGGVALVPARILDVFEGGGQVQEMDGATVITAPATEDGWDELEAAILATLLASARVRRSR